MENLGNMFYAFAQIGHLSEPPERQAEPADESRRTREGTSQAAGASEPLRPRLDGLRGRLVTALVFALALAATVPTTGDIGLTWDEPAYRYSQEMSAQWWERLAAARNWNDVKPLVDPTALLYYWPYARYGINFHPPLAGQLCLAAHAVFGNWMKDIPSRRMASVIEYALTIALAFGFLARRYGAWVGGVAATALLLMPRVYGDGHIAGTDTPGLLLWSATALAFWKGLYEPRARVWRIAVGVLMGLAFIEKMAAVGVLVPLLLWLAMVHLPKTLTRREWKADWIDGLVTSAAMLVPLAIAFLEIRHLSAKLPAPRVTDMFTHAPHSVLPGALLALPLAVWIVRRLVGRFLPGSPTWGVERPALETWTAILAFAPVVSWLGNPVWWRETIPRLAHYYRLNTDRRGSLPDIQILYFDRLYEYSLPWHNAWVLIGITVPATILAAGIAGLFFGLAKVRRDQMPLYFLLHLATLPVLRMFPTPAHDGVRLFLPTFFFLAAFAGWGTVGMADALARLIGKRAVWPRAIVTALVLGPAAHQLIKVHPFELSYYNELMGGPKGAWKAGFELAYWYDAFNTKTLAELNQKLPRHAAVDFFNERTQTAGPVFQEMQSLGYLRKDIVLGAPADAKQLPYIWLLTQDSKAWACSRLLFAMKPWYAVQPPQLDGARVATVADPVAFSRAWALQMLLDSRYEGPIPSASAPECVHRFAPWLGRFWGEGLTRVTPTCVNEAMFGWERNDPAGLRAAARTIAASGGTAGNDPDANRLLAVIRRYDDPKDPRKQFSRRLLHARPEALIEAVDILIAHPDAVRAVMMRYAYTDPDSIGGYLDRDQNDRGRPPQSPEQTAK